MILITAPVHPFLTDYLQAKGYTYRYKPDITYENLCEQAADIEGLFVTTRLPINEKFLSKATRLKWIGRLGSGMEIIDTKFAASKGIVCVSSPEGNCNAVGEHCLGLLLSLSHKIYHAANEVRNGIWERIANRGTEISGKTIGIFGYGNTGRAFTRLLQSFGVTVLAYDKYVYGFGNAYVKEASPEQIGKYSDVISLHLPYTAETHHLVNTEFLNKLERRPILLNTSRGKIVDTTALSEALHKGQISGAGLDVLENEKLSNYTPEEQKMLQHLTGQPNVLITPHIAGYTHEAFKKMAETLIQKLKL